MSLEQNNTKKHQNGMIKSNKIYKGSINEVVNYMNSVSTNNYNIKKNEENNR